MQTGEKQSSHALKYAFLLPARQAEIRIITGQNGSISYKQPKSITQSIYRYMKVTRGVPHNKPNRKLKCHVTSCFTGACSVNKSTHATVKHDSI